MIEMGNVCVSMRNFNGEKEREEQIDGQRLENQFEIYQIHQEFIVSLYDYNWWFAIGNMMVVHLPVYSGKQIVNGLLRIFSSKRSFLFKNRIIDVSVNHLLLQIESNNLRDSCIRFCEMNN